jgi:LmbE family N-acetylglucosaminyl deacetylase
LKLVAATDSIAEITWCAASAVLGRLGRRQASHWKPIGGQRILVVAPHPDDEVVGCAGTLLLHVRDGDSVCIAYITDGSGSRAGRLGMEEMRRQRKLEAEASAKFLQVDRVKWFGLTEGSWTYAELQNSLLDVLRQTSPQLIYAPSQVDFHPEHRKVAHGLSLVLSKESVVPSEAVVRVFQIQVPLAPPLVNRIVDCSGVGRKVEAALKIYRSQPASLAPALRMRHYAARFYGLAGHAEEFWQMPVMDYCRLHQSSPEQWPANRFRGIRYRSFSDPLSYALGWIERRRLRTIPAADDANQI